MKGDHEPKISYGEFKRLQDHVRQLHGLKLSSDKPPKAGLIRRLSNVDVFVIPTTTAGSLASTEPHALPAIDHKAAAIAGKKPLPRTNKTYFFRKQCVQKRLQSTRISESFLANEVRRIHDLNLRPKHADYFKLNKAFHIRWKNIRGLPVVHSHFRDTFLDTGKPPFVVPVHYKPFNVYWDADWAKQEFIFLDAASEDKKKEAGKKSKQGMEQKAPTTGLTSPRPIEDGTASSSKESPTPNMHPDAASSRNESPTPDVQQPSAASSRKESLTSNTQPPGSGPSLRKESSTSDVHQPSANNIRKESTSYEYQPQFASQLKSPRRSDRESTGYEGEPRDSLLEKAQAKQWYMASISYVKGSALASGKI